jgi:uncharacterized membrane protein YgcG
MCKTRAPAGGTLDDFCMRLAQSEDDEVLILMAKALNMSPEKLEQYSPQQYDFWQPGGSGSGLDSDSISAYSDNSDEQEYYAEENAAALVTEAVSQRSVDGSAAVAVATVVNGDRATTATAVTSVSTTAASAIAGAADSGYANLISDAVELLPLDTDGESQTAITANTAAKKPKFGAGKGFTPQANTDSSSSSNSSSSKHSQRIRSQANFVKFGSGGSSSSSDSLNDMALPPPPLPPQSSSSSSSSSSSASGTVDAPVNGVSLQEVAVAAAAAAGLAVPSAAVHSSAVTAASAAAAVAAAAAAYEPAQPMFADPQMLCPFCMPVRGTCLTYYCSVCYCY